MVTYAFDSTLDNYSISRDCLYMRRHHNVPRHDKKQNGHLLSDPACLKIQNVVGIEVTSAENETFYDVLTIKRKRNTPVIQDFVVLQ